MVPPSTYTDVIHGKVLLISDTFEDDYNSNRPKEVLLRSPSYKELISILDSTLEDTAAKNNWRVWHHWDSYRYLPTNGWGTTHNLVAEICQDRSGGQHRIFFGRGDAITYADRPFSGISNFWISDTTTYKQFTAWYGNNYRFDAYVYFGIRPILEYVDNSYSTNIWY